MANLEQHIADLNTLVRFLARRDLEALSSEALEKRFSVRQADLLVLLGNSSLFVAEQAAMAFKQGMAHALMICGGKGHSTHYLAENVKRHPRYNQVPVEDRAEADILQDILVQQLGVAAKDILLENQSTNCGANALEAYRVLGPGRATMKTILLMQDPVLQLRSALSFGKVWEGREEAVFISYAAFIPTLKEEEESITFTNPAFFEFCAMERFLSLVLGEIPRLRNDKDGYGPLGKGFIQPIMLPAEVQNAYERLLPFYSQYLQQRKV